MILEINKSPIFRQSFYYALKVWLSDIVFMGVIFFYFNNNPNLKNWDMLKIFGLGILYSLPFLALFSWVIIGFPTLITVGLFFPDKLDESLKTTKKY